jgi:predicted DNA binding CopG/RHH family protein
LAGEEEERLFWETQAVHHIDLAPPAGGLLERITIAADKRDMPYQSLIKAWLAERADLDAK